MKNLHKLFETLLDKAGTAAKQLQRYPVGAQMLVRLFDRLLLCVGMIMVHSLVTFFARSM